MHKTYKSVGNEFVTLISEGQLFIAQCIMRLNTYHLSLVIVPVYVNHQSDRITSNAFLSLCVFSEPGVDDMTWSKNPKPDKSLTRHKGCRVRYLSSPMLNQMRRGQHLRGKRLPSGTTELLQEPAPKRWLLHKCTRQLALCKWNKCLQVLLRQACGCSYRRKKRKWWALMFLQLQTHHYYCFTTRRRWRTTFTVLLPSSSCNCSRLPYRSSAGYSCIPRLEGWLQLPSQKEAVAD